MQLWTYTVTVTLISVFLVEPLHGESVSVLFEKGVYQEETAGNLDGAIDIYKTIVEQEKANRPLVAQALARLGECRLKQGQLAEAAQAFEDLKARFPDQTELVARTQKKLAAAHGNMSEAQVARLVRDAVRSISTRPEGDAQVSRAIQSLQGVNESSVVKALVGYLSSDEANVRRSAIYVLWNAGFGNITPAVDPLKALCSHSEDLTRGMAALALGGNKVSSSFQLLANMAGSDEKSGYARRCAAYALGSLGDVSAKEILEKALSDPDPLVVGNAKAALKMLSSAGTNKTVANDLAVRNSADAKARALLDPETRQQIADFDRQFTPFFRMDPKYASGSKVERDAIVERWLLEVQGDDFDLRNRAIAALGNVRTPMAVPALLKLAQEDMRNNRPRWLAIRGLGRIGDARAVPVLIELIDHGNGNVRVYSRLGLAQITGVYLGTDKQQWREWWKTHREAPTTQSESWIDEKGRRVDRTDYPFVNDPAVIGTWKSVDFVQDPADFKPGTTQWKGELYLKMLSLRPEGLTAGPWKWTNGRIIHPGDRTAAHYSIKTIDGATYLFFEWKSGDYSLRHEKPHWYVLKKP